MSEARAGSPAIAWRPWQAATFAEAKRTGRPIYLNVIAGWCHWCHVMDDTTLSDPAVVRLLNDHFVPLRLDSDARPDVGERYVDWGWPANAFLTPDARPVLELRGYQEPKPFAALLKDLAGQAARGTLRGRIVRPSPKPATDDVALLRDAVAARLDTFYDAKQGGWGTPQKYPFGAPLEHTLRNAIRGEPGAETKALATLRGQVQLLDDVDGGMFQYSVGGRWDQPHFEKIAAIQAGALRTFALAYAGSGQERWRVAGQNVRDFVLARLRRPDGRFAASLDADATPRHPDRIQPGAATRVPGATYYAADAAQRRSLGSPRRDEAAYADLNGLLAAALAEWAFATGDAEALEAACRALDTTLARQRDAAGLLRHGDSDAGSPSLRHLRDQAAVGLALATVAQAEEDGEYLTAARDLAHAMLEHLAAPEGALLASTPDPDAAGELATRRHPLEDNGLAIRFLVATADLLPHGDEQALGLRRAAERAARALAVPQALEPEGRIIGQFLLGLDDLATPPALIVVAGDGPRAQALQDAALALPWPGRRVRRAVPEDGYPTPAPARGGAGGAAAYVCVGKACSAPVTDPADLVAVLRRMVA